MEPVLSYRKVDKRQKWGAMQSYHLKHKQCYGDESAVPGLLRAPCRRLRFMRHGRQEIAVRGKWKLDRRKLGWIYVSTDHSCADTQALTRPAYGESTACYLILVRTCLVFSRDETCVGRQATSMGDDSWHVRCA